MIWKRALFLEDKDRIAQLNDLRKILRPRPFNSRIKAIDQWVLGFIEGDGGFLVAVRPKQLVQNLPYIYTYFNITQKEKEVLEKIQSHLEMGNVKAKSKNDLDKGYTYDIGQNAHLNQLISRLDQLSFQCTAKYYDFVTWKIIQSMVCKGNHLKPATHQLIIKLIRSMHKYDKV